MNWWKSILVYLASVGMEIDVCARVGAGARVSMGMGVWKTVRVEIEELAERKVGNEKPLLLFNGSL